MDDESASETEPETALEIGWPPIDLNDAAPSPAPRAEPRSALAGAFLGGFLMGVCVLSLITTVAGAMFYYKERPLRPRWANALGVGFFVGLLVFIGVLFYFHMTEYD